MRDKIKELFQKVRDKVSARLAKSPTYAKFLQKRDQLAEKIRVKLLAFFSYIGPVWTFLFLKPPKLGNTNEDRNEFSQVINNHSKIQRLLFFHQVL